VIHFIMSHNVRLTMPATRRIVGREDLSEARSLGRESLPAGRSTGADDVEGAPMNVPPAAQLLLLALTPTLLGAVVICAPKWWAALARLRREREPEPLLPAGLPIEQLAADLRRLLRLHDELTVSAHLAMRAHRLWAVEAAIGVRAVEAARALGVACREPDVPGGLNRVELRQLLIALTEAGLVLPATVGPFTKDGRL
jgi:hypothetical protein